MTGGMDTVMRAAAFVASLGVNTHIDFGGSYANLPTVEAAINYLGIKNLRDSMQNLADLATWPAVSAATGAKFDAYMPEASPAGMAESLATMPRLAAKGVLNYIEGGNEEDDPYAAQQGNTIAFTARFQQRVHEMGRRLHLPVINMSFGAGWTAANNWHGNYDKVGDLSAHADFGNAHTYPNPPDGAPLLAIRQLNADARLAAGSLPVMTTEIGWDESHGFAQDEVARWALDATLDGIREGNPKTWFYALYDDGSGKFGLMHPDGTPKPAGRALHNLTTLLADPGRGAANFPTTGLDVTLAGAREADHTLLLQKSDGHHWLALWNERARSPHTVTVTLPKAAAALRVFDPLGGTAATQNVANAASLDVSLADHPLLVEIADAS